MTDAFMKITRQEGVKALYSGYNYIELISSVNGKIDFIVLLEFGLQCYVRQHMERLNLAHTIH